ncbi:MAG TPA: class I SAM-dependent methyltransferase [Chiayiivirga sp.]|nr:class I SAM-dependent methyltransferase [Chiayiivirga sp.]
MSKPTQPLEFTGERFTPECVREIWYEHMHRYAFAQPLARGLRVLDAACGEGYGSALLAGQAASVMAVDISADAVAHARSRYGAHANLRFEVGDATELDALADGSFDLIVSFETLEHVEAQERMLDGFARLLSPNGLLLVSTPDKHNYTDVSGVVNEFHVRELYRPEFEAMLAARFAAVRLFGQKLVFQSMLWDVSDVATRAGWQASTLDSDDRLQASPTYPPLYYIAACSPSTERVASLPSLALFGDATESVYTHYNDEVRKHIAAGLRLQTLEAELARERALNATLQARLAAQA